MIMLSRNIGRLISLLCFLPVIIVLGCSGGDSTESPFTTSLHLEGAGGLPKASFPTGETITFVISIKNNTSTQQTLTFPSTMMFDIIVLEPGTTRVIWRWSADKVFAQALTGLSFNPKETKIFIEDWDQKDSNKVQVASSVYDSQGIIASDNVFSINFTPNQFRSELVRFNIF
jgi:hypothetical protein